MSGPSSGAPVPATPVGGPLHAARTGAVGRGNPLAWTSAALSALVVSANLSMMSVAFDDLRRSFPGTKLSVLGWVLSVYTIVFGACLVPAGRLADHIGRRTVFLWGLGIFSVASIVAGMAPSIAFVIVGRIGQGLGAACLVPSTMGLLLDALPADRRASATAFYSVVSSVGGVLGPTIGAVLIEQFSWRWAFFIGPVLAVGSWITGIRSLPERRGDRHTALPDLVGALVLMVGLTSLSFGIVESRAWGWSDARIVASFTLALVAIPLFVRRCQRHPTPVLPLHLTRLRSFSVANVASMLYGMSTGALLFGTVLFLRDVWGYSPLQAGSGLLPLAGASTLTALFVGRLGNRFGERAVGVPGTCIVAAGMFLLAWRVGSTPSFVGAWLPGGTVIGLGMGLSYPMVAAATVRDVASSELSVAAASNRTTLQIGNAVGIALLIAILGDAVGVDALGPMRVAWWVTGALALGVATSLALLGPRRRAHTP